jgi:hypothetical protein
VSDTILGLRNGPPADVGRLFSLAEAFDIEIISTNTRTVVPKGTSGGGRGHHCSPRQRRVWIDGLPYHDEAQPEIDEWVAGAFHEIVHVITEPPARCGFKELTYPEFALLIPYEFMLARAIFSRRSLDAVVNYQRITMMDDHLEVGDWKRELVSEWFRF